MVIDMGFEKNFIWGAAAASYQIEGAAFEDGKGASVWDTFTKVNGNIKNDDNGDIACDHYHRYKEDVALMKELGLKAYRFSISWPRILPEGTGKINAKGLQFYSNLVDELLAAGIEPYITLFHWDLPQVLYDRGGWLNRDISDWFAEYVKIVVEHLSDRVNNWITTNEPQCHILLGHELGVHAPGDHATNRELFIMMHNINLAHGKAVQVIRKYSKQPCRVGYAPNPGPTVPATASQADYEASKAYAFSATARNLWSNTWWLDPVLLGKYPEDGLNAFKEEFPKEMIMEGDMEIIHQPLDFLGINLYQGAIIRQGDQGPIEVTRKTGFDKTALKWLVIPEIMYYMPKFLYERYHLPIVITENGLTLSDWVSLDGRVHDPNRIDFMHRYLKELKKASEEGVKIIGYFAWSVMDNFEWS
ncbi:MAG TPA: GH1 family beta-glucosidase, partial [Mobilitalea sp.]|nr:GH1 family beta-glucosidase [Mobilitalea sp.]